ncbi:hypothetical protein ACJW30_10G028000 [Castanea mollissima]
MTGINDTLGPISSSNSITGPKQITNIQDITRPSELLSEPDTSSIFFNQKVMNFQSIKSQSIFFMNFPSIRHLVKSSTCIDKERVEITEDIGEAISCFSSRN